MRPPCVPCAASTTRHKPASWHTATSRASPKACSTKKRLPSASKQPWLANDADVAATLAHQYLGRYPAGRFVSLARKTASAARP